MAQLNINKLYFLMLNKRKFGPAKMQSKKVGELSRDTPRGWREVTFCGFLSTFVHIFQIFLQLT